MIGTLDTHELVKDLKASGFTDAQAEAVTRAVRLAQDLDLSNLATKTDLVEVRIEVERVRSEVERVRSEVERVRGEMAALETRLIKWVIGVAVAAVIAITGALSGVIWAAMQVLLHALPHS